MEVEITEVVRKKRVVDVPRPYYYQQCLDSEYTHGHTCTLYGKIDGDDHTTIRLEAMDGYRGATVTHEQTNWDDDSCYLQSEFRSSAAAYRTARLQAELIFNLCDT